MGNLDKEICLQFVPSSDAEAIVCAAEFQLGEHLVLSLHVSGEKARFSSQELPILMPLSPLQFLSIFPKSNSTK